MQAARGATITPAAQASAGRRVAVGIAATVAVAGVLLDQITKAMAIARLRPYQVTPVLPPLLQFRLVRNPGAAFSLGEGSTWLFAVLAVLVLTGTVVYVLPRLRMRAWAVFIGLFMAGIAGNLVDRLLRPPAPLRGHVVDFLELPHWPIFNVADMCITAAAVGLTVLATVAKVGYDGAPAERRRDRTAAGAGDRPTDEEPA